MFGVLNCNFVWLAVVEHLNRTFVTLKHLTAVHGCVGGGDCGGGGGVGATAMVLTGKKDKK